MNERQCDFALLREFARDGRQAAFTTLVRRHLDLVYATALRKAGDAGGAEEIAQNVFSALARKAWQFAPDDSLPAWLYKTALLESKSWLRGELRRRRREQTAAELGTTMKTPEDQPAFNALVPLLDDALLSLREKDRTALLLRYYESHSLRDVGAAFGVSEDTAQKRVQGALEQVAEFFKRRGFKTATVAATAAALQHTAASASAAVASTVVRAALHAAPPAFAGLNAWLARLASLSRVQTAAVCVVLAAAPVGWQLNERHAAGEEAKRIQTQLLAAQNERETAQTEIERLRAISGRLEQSVTQKNEAAARAAESAQAFAAWKKRVRGRLTAADYRWSDDSPFVRIPKSVLPELSKLSGPEPFSPPGVVAPYARELMGMTPAECQAVEELLHRHFADREGKIEAGIYETNKPLSGGVVASRVFLYSVPDDHDEAKQLADQILAEMRGLLGEERWPLVQARLPQSGGPVYSSNFGRILEGNSSQELKVEVNTNDKGMLNVSANWGGAVAGYYNGALSQFLPEGDPNRTEGSDGFGRFGVAEALRRRALAWLQEQAIARLGKGASR
ncbi:MAG: sigma-70 family RNA polymerase sigma factor [Verrucomicrobiota bacterium]|jgi:RNA polymerase sigma factor (sigma-70 family)